MTDVAFAGARAIEQAAGEARNLEYVFILFFGQPDHEIELEILDATADQHLGRVQNFRSRSDSC